MCKQIAFKTRTFALSYVWTVSNSHLVEVYMTIRRNSAYLMYKETIGSGSDQRTSMTLRMCEERTVDDNFALMSCLIGSTPPLKDCPFLPCMTNIMCWHDSVRDATLRGKLFWEGVFIWFNLVGFGVNLTTKIECPAVVSFEFARSCEQPILRWRANKLKSYTKVMNSEVVVDIDVLGMQLLCKEQLLNKKLSER